MEELYNTLAQSTSYLAPLLKNSTMALLFTALSVLALVIFLLVILKKLYNRAKQKKLLHKLEDGNKKKVGFFQRIKDAIIGFFNRIGLLHDANFGRSFYLANKFLASNLGGRHYAYKIPRYLLVGTENAGKTTLLNSLDERLFGSIGNNDASAVSNAPGGTPSPDTTTIIDKPLQWRFFDTGSVLDVPGEYFIQENAIDSDQSSWDKLLRLLVHYRVQKPLDGLILTIPADELAAFKKLDAKSLARRAGYIRGQLDRLAKKIGFVIPLYVVVTKSDKIVGYQDFINLLPQEKRNDMIGWSCSFSMGEEFSPAWVAEGFHTILDRSQVNQMEAMGVTTSVPVAEKLVQFAKGLDSIETPLAIYLQEIFKKTTPYQNFFFRGFYLVGRPSQNPLQVGEGASTPDGKPASSPTMAATAVIPSLSSPQGASDQGGAEEASPNLETSRQDPDYADDRVHPPSQAKDLFFCKIFPEFKIAIANQSRLFSISRSINIARLLILLTCLGWGWGLWHEHATLTHRMTVLAGNLEQGLGHLKDQEKKPVLTYINNGLPALSDNDAVRSINYIKQTLQLLGSINDKSSFRSYFAPTTWSGYYDKQFKKAAGVLLNRLVFESFNNLFIYKLALFSSTVPPSLSSFTTKIAIFDPTQMPEFILFRGFVEMAAAYDDALSNFEQLLSQPDVAVLDTLSQFLCDVPLPQEFTDNASFYESVITYAEPKSKVAYTQYNAPIIHITTVLHQDFVNALFQRNPSFDFLNSLIKFFDIDGGDLVTAQSIQEALAMMEYLYRYVAIPSFEWIENTQTFDPGYAYDKTLGIVSSLGFYSTSPNLRATLQDAATSQLPNFLQRLAKLNTNTFDNLFTLKNGLPTARTSEAFTNLLVNFKRFLSQDFMDSIDTPQTLFTTIPAGKYLIWNPLMLESVNTWLEGYTTFINQDLGNFAKPFQEHMKLLGRKHLTQHILTTFARAQTFIDAPSNLTPYSLEDAVRTQVTNFKKVAPIFQNVLQNLEANQINTAYIELRNLIVGQAYALLQSVDTFFSADSFYMPLQGNFDAWTGDTNLAYQAYNASDAFGLQTYVTAQNARVLFIVNELATPLVQFLTQSFLHLDKTDAGLLAKWEQIMAQAQAFSAHKPGNSVLAINTFIQKDMNGLDAKNCNEKLAPLVQKNTYGLDWFSQQLLNIQLDLYAQCQKLTKQQGTQAYQGLQSYFNARLSGRYPFTGGQLTNTVGEATPDDIRTFFTLYDQAKPAIDTYITSLNNPSETASVQAFLQQLEAVKEFFGEFLATKNPLALPLFEVGVAFRTNKRFEIGANQLLQWAFNVSASQVTNMQPKPTITWQYGEPVGVSLQWVSGGPFAPAADPSNPFMVVQGTTVQISEQGPWGLLKFIEMFKAPLNFTDPYQSQVVHSLMFTVPTQATQIPGAAQVIMNRLFINLTLSKLDKNKVPTPITLPVFPGYAPSFGSRE